MRVFIGTNFDRREFLRSAGALAAAFPLGGILASCGDPSEELEEESELRQIIADITVRPEEDGRTLHGLILNRNRRQVAQVPQMVWDERRKEWASGNLVYAIQAFGGDPARPTGYALARIIGVQEVRLDAAWHRQRIAAGEVYRLYRRSNHLVIGHSEPLFSEDLRIIVDEEHWALARPL